MARTKQYVTYTREFTKGNVNSKVGVFIEDAKNTLDNKGNVNGGVIKFRNLKMSRPTPTKKLIDNGYDFNVRVLATSNYETAKTLRNEMVSLLSASGRTVINSLAA